MDGVINDVTGYENMRNVIKNRRKRNKQNTDKNKTKHEKMITTKEEQRRPVKVPVFF